jgi:hypothetical protein
MFNFKPYFLSLLTPFLAKIKGEIGSSIKTVSLTSASNKITSTVNGTSADLTPALGTVAQRLGFDSLGNLVRDSNATVTSGQFNSVDGVNNTPATNNHRFTLTTTGAGILYVSGSISMWSNTQTDLRYEIRVGSTSYGTFGIISSHPTGSWQSLPFSVSIPVSVAGNVNIDIVPVSPFNGIGRPRMAWTFVQQGVSSNVPTTAINGMITIPTTTVPGNQDLQLTSFILPSAGTYLINYTFRAQADAVVAGQYGRGYLSLTTAASGRIVGTEVLCAYFPNGSGGGNYGSTHIMQVTTPTTVYVRFYSHLGQYTLWNSAEGVGKVTFVKISN